MELKMLFSSTPLGDKPCLGLSQGAVSQVPHNHGCKMATALPESHPAETPAQRVPGFVPPCTEHPLWGICSTRMICTKTEAGDIRLLPNALPKCAASPGAGAAFQA